MSTSFASWLAHELARREWNQATFAKRGGFSTGAVSMWIRGERVPDPASCEKIADVFHTDPDMVLVFAGHRPNLDDELAPGDPRTDLIALVRRVRWNPEREAAARALLEVWIKHGKEKP